jgi:hypothetical protein
MVWMFWNTKAFNQDIGNWDISSLTNAIHMFKDTSMTLNNMDSTLRGWAKLDSAAGESAIQNDVGWSIANYTDAKLAIKIINLLNKLAKHHGIQQRRTYVKEVRVMLLKGIIKDCPINSVG